MLDYVGKDDGRNDQGRRRSDADVLGGRPGPTSLDAIAGANLRRIRISRGFTQERLAERLGITYQAVQRLEAGKIQFSVNRVVELAGILEVTIPDFYRGAGIFPDVSLTPIIDINISKEGRDLGMAHDAIVCPNVRAKLRELSYAVARAID